MRFWRASFAAAALVVGISPFFLGATEESDDDAIARLEREKKNLKSEIARLDKTLDAKLDRLSDWARPLLPAGSSVYAEPAAKPSAKITFDSEHAKQHVKGSVAAGAENGTRAHTALFDARRTK
jgi:hypothetical protein